MEGYAMPVLRMSKNAPTAHRSRHMTRCSVQMDLKAVPTARTVSAKLAHGPQSIAPAMTAIARSGKNDLPATSLVLERNSCHGRPMLRSPEI
jgi:hypothetical protein